jgi:MFS transporter, DHA2 family, multidrug resistance protein
MSYLGGGAEHFEQWEQEEDRSINESLSNLTNRGRITILLSVGLVTAIEVSSRLSVNVLLPDMQGNVAANSDEISWVLILYNVGFLCSMALATWMTRVIGARRHLLYSIALYSAGALGCAMSSRNLESLLVSRLVMGFGGGAFLVRTVILAGLMFPGKARIGAVTRLYALLFVFQISYPVSIGWIADRYYWNYAFLLDFPFLAIGAFLIWKFVPRGYLFRQSTKSRVDVRGPVLLIASLICLQTATSRGERDMWFDSSWIALALLAAVIFFIAFVWWERRPENVSPVFHLRAIWRHASLRTSFSVILIVGAILGAGLFVVPQYLRYVQDYSATQTGGFISMYTTGLGTGLLLTLRVGLPKIGGPRTIALGLLLLIVTCASIVYIWTPNTPAGILRVAISLQGLALGPILLGAANIATANAPLADVNDISTTYFFTRQLGNTFGVTAATILFDHRMTLHSSRLLDTANRLDPIVQSTLTQYANLIHRNGGGSSNPVLGALQIFQADVITQSKLLSYVDIYFGLAVLAGLGLFLLAFTRLKSELGSNQFHLL